MRMQFRLLWGAVALLAALALPATTFAGHGVFYRITSASCSPGEAGFALNFVAKGNTDVNRFKVRAWVEQRSISGGTWSHTHFPQVDQTFTADGTRHRLQINHCYADSLAVYTRFIVHLQAFNDAGIVFGGKVRSGKM